jgi:hypothetical protein
MVDILNLIRIAERLCTGSPHYPSLWYVFLHIQCQLLMNYVYKFYTLLRITSMDYKSPFPRKRFPSSVHAPFSPVSHSSIYSHARTHILVPHIQSTVYHSQCLMHVGISVIFSVNCVENVFTSLWP